MRSPPSNRARLPNVFALAGTALMFASPAAAQTVSRWQHIVAEASQRFGIPVVWIERVMRAESGGRTTLRGRPIVSRAGAMGLMQLMPGTWGEMRRMHGLGDNPHDPRDNIHAGTAYLRAMYDRFGYPGMFAAYNAGPGNVNKWLRANGDPRMPGVDMLKWVEDIPIFETKNYVQRVLENAVVYDLMNPDKARSRGPANLSWYLGKTTPG